MNFRLSINDKLDPTLLLNFPRDPYADIKIITKTQYLELSLAYLSIDSQYFANLPQDCSQIDLSKLNEEALILVLRALYGGQLQVFSIVNLQEIFKVIKVLQIDEFKNKIDSQLRKHHGQKQQNSILNNIEMIQFCIKNHVIEDLLLQYHFQNKLKVLQSSKNYLQLIKLTDQNLNFILMEFQKSQYSSESTINHILQNYFNRKSIRPVDYFKDQKLINLQSLWEKFHHKIVKAPLKLEKTSSVQPNQSMIQSKAIKYSEIITNPKIGKLANFNAINTQSINLETEYFKFQSINDEQILDSRIQKLTKDLNQKNNKIKSLQQQIKQLLELKRKRQKTNLNINIEQSIDDLTLLKDIVMSKKTKEELCKTDRSNNPNQQAYDNYKKPVEQQREVREGKIKIVSKNIMNKKIFS